MDGKYETTRHMRHIRTQEQAAKVEAKATGGGFDRVNTESVWLTAKEAAQYLKVEPRTLLLWARQGKLKAYALSGAARHVWRFRVEDLDAALLPSPVLPSSGSSAVPAEKEAAC